MENQGTYELFVSELNKFYAKHKAYFDENPVKYAGLFNFISNPICEYGVINFQRKIEFNYKADVPKNILDDMKSIQNIFLS